jgi:phytoene dehydrogenase-like protein
MDYDAIVVGGGIAGLVTTAYLTKAGYTTLLCEKENTCGGLINTFERDGFFFDGGIRAIEDSGVLLPMLDHLGLDVELVRNQISIGVEDRVIMVDSEKSLLDYQELLTGLYPESKEDIVEITAQIREIMKYMKIQYGIKNPLFLDMKKDRAYMLKVILPWVLKYALTAPKIAKLNEPVEDYLKRFTQNQSLLDLITQHFFQKTPAFFALSYLSLYLDYSYPLGGTGKLIEKMVALIESNHGTISTNTTIISVDPEKRLVVDDQHRSHGYRRLIWAADQKALYRSIDPGGIADGSVKKAIEERRAMLADKSGNDSVYTLYLAVDLDKSYFASKASEHYFYTPSRTGQSAAGPMPEQGSQETIKNWLEKFFSLTTYEISIPVMRDATMAPPGKTGLIVSLLFDYRLTKHIEETGWYEDFKSFCEMCIINALNASIYPGIKDVILQQFSATPLTMAKFSGNSDGAITGWAFSNDPMPAESRLPKVLNSITTPVPGIVQAGQWTFSPSGLPISIMTGKIAADRVIKELAKAEKS